MADLILAHDIGTSGNKATLYSVEGNLVASSTVDYPTRFFNANWAEQDPHLWWEAVSRASREVLLDVDPDRIGAVSFSGQMMACVCMDKSGRVIRDAIIWADSRSVKQIESLKTRIDPADGYGITGHRLSPSYTLGKLLWIRDNEPDNYRQIYKILNPKDFIIYKLTGAWVTDETDASGTNIFDLEQRQWSQEIIAAAGISPDLLPDIVPSPTVVGSVTNDAARQTGLRAGTPVVCGAGDGLCASVGAGCVQEGRVYTSLGTSAWIATATRSPLADPQMRTFTFAHAVPNLYGPCGAAQAVGSAFNWARDTIYAGDSTGAGAARTDVNEMLNEVIASAPVGAHRLLFLPYLLGERSPWWNPDARGAFIGLTMEHSKSDLLRAVVEGIFLTMRLILDILRPNVNAEVMDVIGGFARGEVQQRIMADVYGMPLAISENLAEATSMGAAVIGGVGTGILEGFGSVSRFRNVARVVDPDPRAHERYSELLPVFEESYRSLENVYARLAADPTDG
jgi:xylulokinase